MGLRPACALILACGCGGEAGPQVPSPLRTRIDAAVERITADTCFSGSDVTACDWADSDLASSRFDMAVSTGEAILIVDDFGDGMFPQLLRYRNRLLGLYRVSGDGVERREISVHLPRQLGDALVSFAGPEFIPASALGAVGAAAGTAYGRVPLLFLGHGGVVFSHLVELAPEQPLVLLELTGLLGLLPSLCDRVDEETLTAAAAHFTAVAASLRQLMRRHGVRFVNASFGDSAQTLTADWSHTCGRPAPNPEGLRQLLHLYDPVYDALFATEGVIAAQAAASLGDPADFPFDQRDARSRNRVRVGFISSRSSGLDELGRGALRSAGQFPASVADADVFVNWGCEPLAGCGDLRYELAGGFGLASGPLPLMSTSYVTPLGLGRLINLRYAGHGAEPMSDALIATLARELTPPFCGASGTEPCAYQDPIAHRQLEVYRRGYK